MAPPRIFLSGGSGMVGRNLLEHPALRAYEVLAPRRAELDLADYAATEAYLRRLQPDLVVHAAGRVGGIQANIAHPVAFLVENVDIGRNIIMAARAAGVRRLLNLASSCMYPRAAPSPFGEDLILKGELEPTNEGYALAKIFATRLAQYISREQPEYRYKTLIPCNLYGRHDKFSPEHSHLLAAVIVKLHQAKARGEKETVIWGDGLARREFLYAGDFADAVARAIVEFDRLPEIMNIGVGEDHTINDYYAAAAEVVGWQGRFVHDLSKPVGMARKMVDIERQLSWGWRARTSLREGLARTYAYYLEQAQA